MASAAKPPFRADHVGSLLRPDAVKRAREKFLDGKFDAKELGIIEDKAIREVVALQESVGLHSVTDGEFRRTSFHFDFLGRIEGVSAVLGRAPDPNTPSQSFQPPALKIVGKIRHARPIELEGFQFLKSVTKRTAKLTMPSPTMLLRGGRSAVSETAYPDLDGYFQDAIDVYVAELKVLGDAGCSYVQFDDTNFAYLCDQRMRQAMRERGEDPDALPHRYVKLINAVIARKPAGMTIAIHLCRGNMAGRWAAEGGYEPIAEPVFGQLAVDGYFLEYESARAGGFRTVALHAQGTARHPRSGQLEGAGDGNQEHAEAPHRRSREVHAGREHGGVAAMRLRVRLSGQPGHRGYRAAQAGALRRDRGRCLGLGRVRRTERGR